MSECQQNHRGVAMPVTPKAPCCRDHLPDFRSRHMLATTPNSIGLLGRRNHVFLTFPKRMADALENQPVRAPCRHDSRWATFPKTILLGNVLCGDGWRSRNRTALAEENFGIDHPSRHRLFDGLGIPPPKRPGDGQGG